ncbi:MAG: transcriptional repressor [Myxococcales bacterium]|nr:transcriptional repressor [Polyangiaceae bacterium]MDW8247705.1 transcriptional repressor [Myxococcales bacterium]
MTPERSKANHPRLRSLLEQRGLRVTVRRLAVLQALGASRRPLSHGELADELVTTGMDRATVYRNLMVLAEAKLLLRTRMPDGIFRFELLRQGGRAHKLHPYLVCTECGQVRCLPRQAVSVKPGLGDVLEVQLRGRCLACLQG